MVLGGRSEIGLALARRLVVGEGPHDVTGATVVLAARPGGETGEPETLLRAAGAADVDSVEFDADDTGGYEAVLATIEARHGRLDVVITAFGVLGDQRRAEHDVEHALAVVHTDYLAHVGMLTLLAQRMRKQGGGRLVVFSSVAGVRVRRANYVYGSAKAGLDGFASGLADALVGSGVHLLLVRPGFVVGRMTEGMKPAPLASTPEQVAAAAAAGLRRRRSEVWVPGLLRPMFAVMRMLPRPLWRRLPR